MYNINNNKIRNNYNFNTRIHFSYNLLSSEYSTTSIWILRFFKYSLHKKTTCNKEIKNQKLLQFSI